MKKFLALILSIILFASPITAQAAVVDWEGNPKSFKVSNITSEATYENYVGAQGDVLLLDVGQEIDVQSFTATGKGLFNIQVANIAGSNPYGNITIGVYKDKECTQQVESNLYLYDTDTNAKSKDIYLPAKGTYYLGVKRTKTDYAAGIAFKCAYVNGADRTLANNKATFAFSDYNHKDIYYKVAVTKPGLITANLKFLQSGSAYVTLCNSSKKAISNQMYVSTSSGVTPYFAVAKGNYYIKVSSSAGMYQIKSTTTAVTDQSGATKAKAVALKKGGATKKGLVTLNDKTSKVDWYKVTLSSSQNVTFNIVGKASGSIKMQIVPAKGKITFGDSVTISESRSGMTLKSSGKWPKGTYYVKITKTNVKNSGYYAINVK